MARRLLYLAVGTLLLAGCAPSPPSPEVLASADYGGYPNDYQDVIQSYMNGVLIDPGSAQYEWIKGPKKGWIGTMGGGQHFGYAVCAWINAKNRFGGYTGRQLHFFMLHDGQVAEHAGGSSDWEQIKAEKWCKGF